MVHLHGSNDATGPVGMRLRYQAADPYAVHATFHVGDLQTVEWVFAREQLAEGLHQPVGLGDVRIGPVRMHGHHLVRIALKSSAGQAVLTAPAPEVASFVRRTEALVPPGSEESAFDLDAQLAQIVRDT
ncbi:SsgA family sporulation/cell division regulator [Streptomyces sp. NPDC005480]|uniref:SsgA family sporulation/cell division regulator n=1 Tax=Streptomyces sp. NPDC005480 TaxID=3154880 RepID=UPI0033A180BA